MNDAPGLETAANAAVQALLDRFVAEGSEIGIQVCAYHNARMVVDAWSGVADTGTGRPVDGDTLFNAFSVAKAVTATAVHIQAERGLIDYEAPVATYWPGFTGEGRELVTVRHVLTHRSGMHKMPASVTAEQICDWDYMVAVLQETAPAFAPGSVSGYQSMTFGWLLGEIVRLTDPERRDFGSFVREEIAEPLGIRDLWLGIPAAAHSRVAIMDGSAVSVIPDGTPYRETCPIQVDLMPATFGQPKVREACIPAVGSIFTARAEARFFAMLANGGELDGVRLLSKKRVAMCGERRFGYAENDTVFFGTHVPISAGGYWLGAGLTPPTCSPRNPRAICHPGMGGSIGWADPDNNLAVAFCHNRLFDGETPEEDNRTIAGDLIRKSLGIH